MEQELLTFPDYLGLRPGFIVVRVVHWVALYAVFADLCLSFFFLTLYCLSFFDMGF
jgi:hypothetical protein